MDEQEKIKLAAGGKLPAEFMTEEIAYTARYNLYAAACIGEMKRESVNEHILRLRCAHRGQDSTPFCLQNRKRIPRSASPWIAGKLISCRLARTVHFTDRGRTRDSCSLFPEGSLKFLALKRFRKPANG